MPRLRLTRSNPRIFALSVLAVGVLALCGIRLAAQDSPSPEPTVRQAVRFAVSPPLRDLAKLPRAPHYGVHEALPVRRIPKHDFGVTVDPVEQNTLLAPAANYTIGLNILGVGNGFPGYTVPDAPPDTNMAVGDTQIVQWVNVSFAIFNKFSGAVEVGPIDGNLLFSALGAPCATNNSGDIIAQWDNAAHQWLLAQNVFSGPPYYACVAVSMTADATGAYYVYQFPLGNGFPDYPKWGRWNTTWAQTMNNFGPGGSGFVGPEVCVYERARLLVGSPFPRQVCFQLASDGDSLLPADIDSPTSPPSTEDQFFIGSVADVSTHQLSLYSVHIDWLHPSGATITGNHNSQLVTVPTYTGSCPGGSFGGDCVPQKGIPDLLDSLSDRLMYRFAYYSDAGPSGKQHWYVNHDVGASAGQSGVRWYEFRAPKIAILPGLAFTLYQAGTYAPDANWRWMGSIAADMNNDILAGYSESSSSMYPSIAVAGRLPPPADPLGTLEPELAVVAGTGSQPDTSNRWGDYSAMRIDPVDNCTFWYTTEYYMVTQIFDWSTQIANIKFAGCHNPAADGYIELCKQTDPDYPVPGPFSFTLTAPFFSAGPYVVPVGSCSPPIQVPSGLITINEAPQIGVAVENVTAYSDGPFGQINELDSWTFPDQTATVTVMPGGVNLETVATYTNYAAPPGTLKICKIAGNGVAVGTPFTFTATDGTTQHRDIVNAGPAPGGNCVIDGTWPVNDPVTVTETLPPGVSVSKITVEPPGRGGNQTSNSVVVTIGNGFTEVDFTDVAVAIGSCEPSSSLSVLLVSGTNVVAYVPEGNWNGGSPGVAVANIEGNYVVGAPFIVNTGTDVINSCASDPLVSPPQTLCTANYPSNLVYVIQGNPPHMQYTVASGGSSEIHFSGGYCLNCGIAMDALHSKAVLGLSINGVPGFQFLDLNGAAPVPETPPIASTAGQISEDPLIDPISNPPLLLSPGEGTDCVGLPPGTCYPNYEIVDITDTRNPVFYENELDALSGWPGGRPDSAGADCSAQIALAQIEDPSPSTPYIADLTKAKFNVPTLGMWSDTASQFYPLSGSLLTSTGDNGPVAVAQGGSHEGVMGQEFGEVSPNGNTITAFRLNVPYNASMPFADWVTCNLGGGFVQGDDPHTMTAYQSPNGSKHSFAVIANEAPASALAVVDLDLMLSPTTVSRWPQVAYSHVCNVGVPTGSPPGTVGTLPQSPAVVRFPPL